MEYWRGLTAAIKGGTTEDAEQAENRTMEAICLAPRQTPFPIMKYKIFLFRSFRVFRGSKICARRRTRER
jgi:hypothetical protein